MPMCVNGISLGSSSRTGFRPGTCEAGMLRWRVRLSWVGRAVSAVCLPSPPLCVGPGPPPSIARHRLYACSGVPHLTTSIPLVYRPGCREVSSRYLVLRAPKTCPHFWPLGSPIRRKPIPSYYTILCATVAVISSPIEAGLVRLRAVRCPATNLTDGRVATMFAARQALVCGCVSCPATQSL